MEKTYFKLNNKLNIPVDGAIDVGVDQEAVRQYFLEEINMNLVHFESLEEKLTYLIDNNYIEKEFIELYDMEFIKKLYNEAKIFKYRFKSFAGAFKFYTQYAMKTNDNSRFLERYEDRVIFNALFLANGDKELAYDLFKAILKQEYQPATPTFANAGKKRRGEFISCFLISLEDNMNSIGRGINSMLQLSRIGGGVGVNLSNIRALGSKIKDIDNASSGVVPIMKLAEDSFSYSNQLGQRAGAGVVYLSVFHQDIERFLSTKKENADEKVRVKTLSLGITVPDKFYELVQKDAYIHLFDPYEVEKQYGKPFSYINITEEYDNLLANPNINSKVLKARDLETSISKLQQESGYPYIINIDTVNKENQVDGTVIMSNLCSEVTQVQKPSVVSDDQSYEVLGEDISCNLGSLNLVNLINSDNFSKTVDVAMRALNHVTESSNIETVPTVANGNKNNHTTGLGAMGLHTLFAVNEMHYGSPESLELVDYLFMAINYQTLVTSMELAKVHGPYKEFDKSGYADGSYFLDRYLTAKDKAIYSTPISTKVADILSQVYLPTEDDWVDLRDNIKKYGLRNAYRMTVAPNGSISYIQETSASLSPIITKIEKRSEGKLGHVFYPAPYLSNKTFEYYTSAYELSMLAVIDVYATAQKHIDQSMSLTLFFDSTISKGLYPWKPEGGKATTRDLSLVRMYAWKKGIKSIYYVRTFTDDEDIVGVSTCESCLV